MKWPTLIMLALFPLFAWANEGSVALDKAHINLDDTVSLQRGAQLFTNYCVSCHGAASMRYNRLKDLGLTDKQIKAFLVPPGQKVGDTMTIAMDKKDAANWFGATPPDLSVIARSRGADWLYTYLKSFYRDDSRPTGWNNLVFDKVGMPHVLYELQGEQILAEKKIAGEEGSAAEVVKTLELVKPGSLTHLENGKANTLEYDARALDLVNFLVYLGEPSQSTRHRMGYIVLFLLIFVLLPLTYWLKHEYWQDIHKE